MLNILENFDVASLDPFGADRVHLVLEAARLGYAIRDTHIADGAHMRRLWPDCSIKASADLRR
jgi:gamma-glutamyltranspeptidase/glutathione hydrolase